MPANTNRTDALLGIVKQVLLQEDSRHNFLNDVIITAIESGHIGSWQNVITYEPGNETQKAHATLQRADEDTTTPTTYTVTHETIQEGLSRIWGHTIADPGTLNSTSKEILQADLMNDAAILDAISANVILEYGLFGETIYT